MPPAALEHKHPWTDPGVNKVFQTWRGILPIATAAAVVVLIIGAGVRNARM